MPTIIVSHKVGDFDTWIKGHQERMELFAPAVTGFQTFQDKDDPNSVSLVIDVTDMDKLGAIINDPANQNVKDKHTVKEPITISVPVEV